MGAARRSRQDALSHYFSKLRGISRLSREEERELLQNVKQGRRDALDDLIASNLGFVVKVARDYRGLGLPFEDLLTEGNIGLVEAARRFDPKKKTKFITYAVWWIRKAILKALADHANLVRLPSYQWKRIQEVLEAEACLSRQLGRQPTREEISAKLCRKLSKIDEQLQMRRREVSLDDGPGTDDDRHFAEFLEDVTSVSAEQRLILEETRKHLHKALVLLNRQERLVLIYRFGLHGEPGLTLKEVGRRLGLSRERIRQLENQAKGRLRKYLLRNKWIKSPYRGPIPSLPSRSRRIRPHQD